MILLLAIAHYLIISARALNTASEQMVQFTYFANFVNFTMPSFEILIYRFTNTSAFKLAAPLL